MPLLESRFILLSKTHRIVPLWNLDNVCYSVWCCILHYRSFCRILIHSDRNEENGTGSETGVVARCVKPLLQYWHPTLQHWFVYQSFCTCSSSLLLCLGREQIIPQVIGPLLSERNYTEFLSKPWILWPFGDKPVHGTSLPLSVTLAFQHIRTNI